MVAPDIGVIDLLLDQHQLIHRLLDEAQGATDAADRREAADRLVRLLAVHEQIEEQVVHPYARRTLADGEQVVADRRREEREVKQLRAELAATDVTDPEFAPLLAQLRLVVLAHAASEERHELAALLEHTSPGQRLAMAVAARAAATLAPPYPDR